MNTGTWMVVDEKGQQVGKVSLVPILTLKKGERVSYISGEFYILDINQRRFNQIEHICKQSCQATICNQNDLHSFFVIGEDPDEVNQTVHYIQHMFGAVDLDCPVFSKKSIFPFLPELKSFLERVIYLHRWLFTGRTEKNVRRPKIKHIKVTKTQLTHIPPFGT